MTPQERVEIDRITRVVEAQGWTITMLDVSGMKLILKVEKPKTEQVKGS